MISRGKSGIICAEFTLMERAIGTRRKFDKKVGNRGIMQDFKFPDRVQQHLDSREITRAFTQPLDWVEDSAFKLIKRLKKGEKIADYLRVSYPENFKIKTTRTGGKRYPLLFRLMFLIDELLKYKDKPSAFQSWRFSAYQESIEILIYMLAQVYGEKVAAEFEAWLSEFSKLWKTTKGYDESEVIARKLESLKADLSTAFTNLHDRVAAKENAAEPEKASETKPEVMEKLESIEKSVKNNGKMIAETYVVVEAGKLEADYSKYAGLSKISEVKRRQIIKAIIYSHNGYEVEKDARGKDANTLRSLASAVWKDNKDEFEKLATLGGYKNEEAFGSALYRLADKYPEADHFVWSA